MRDGPMAILGWWQLETAANALVSVAYLAIALPILVPLVRVRQITANKLATATGLIFLSCSSGHAVHAFIGVNPSVSDTGAQMGMNLVDGADPLDHRTGGGLLPVAAQTLRRPGHQPPFQ